MAANTTLPEKTEDAFLRFLSREQYILVIGHNKQELEALKKLTEDFHTENAQFCYIDEAGNVQNPIILSDGDQLDSAFISHAFLERKNAREELRTILESKRIKKAISDMKHVLKDIKFHKINGHYISNLFIDASY